MTAAQAIVANEATLSAQACFRAMMNAMARPGTVQALAGCEDAPPPMSPAVASVARALFDHDTLVWLDAPLADSPEVTRWLRFHTGAPLTDDPGEAHFALIAYPERMPQLSTFHPGTPEYPDRAATVILQVERLTGDAPLALAGPGIRGPLRFGATPLPEDWTARLAVNRGLFPRGVDLLLVTDRGVAALPRSVRLFVERG